MHVWYLLLPLLLTPDDEAFQQALVAAGLQPVQQASDEEEDSDSDIGVEVIWVVNDSHEEIGANLIVGGELQIGLDSGSVVPEDDRATFRPLDQEEDGGNICLGDTPRTLDPWCDREENRITQARRWSNFGDYVLDASGVPIPTGGSLALFKLGPRTQFARGCPHDTPVPCGCGLTRTNSGAEYVGWVVRLIDGHFPDWSIRYFRQDSRHDGECFELGHCAWLDVRVSERTAFQFARYIQGEWDLGPQPFPSLCDVTLDDSIIFV
jgi:hypothetical protein